MLPISIAAAAFILAPQPPPAPAPVMPASQAGVLVTASGLRLQVLEPGNGARPGVSDAVLVTYEGRLADGTVFDAAPAPAGLRVADLIPGFTEALLLMNKGGRYRIWIPPGLAYGAAGSADRSVPPNAQLEFTIRLVAIGRVARSR